MYFRKSLLCKQLDSKLPKSRDFGASFSILVGPPTKLDKRYVRPYKAGMEMTPTELRSVLARNLQSRRLELDLTQEQLATRAGLHQPQISLMERGLLEPELSTLARLAEALDSTPSALLSTALAAIPAAV